MKIEMLRSIGRNAGPDLPEYLEGQVLDVDEKEGQKLADMGLALIRGVPKKPKITAPAPEPVDLNEENSDTMKRFKAKGKESKK